MLMSECVSVCVHECMCVCVIIEILALGKITKVTRFNLPSSLAFNSIITIWKHLPSNSLRGKWGKNVIWFILWSQKKWWTREMVWSIKCWSHKCENQSLILRIHLKKTVVLCAYDQCWETEDRRTLGACQTACVVWLGTPGQWQTLSQAKKVCGASEWMNDSRDFPLGSNPYVHMYTWITFTIHEMRTHTQSERRKYITRFR